MLALACGAAGLLAQTPPTHVADPTAGGKLFERHCVVCHGIEGKGGRGPNLHRATLAHAPDDAALRRVIAEGIPPEMPEGWFLSDDDVADVAAYVRSLGTVAQETVPGDAAHGRQVYRQHGCMGCHVVQGEGGGYGISLDDIGARRGAQHIDQAIRNPAGNLPEGFLFVEAKTADGTVRGVRVNEDTFSIQIKDMAGEFHSFRKSSLVDLRKLRGETPMPSFESLLTPADLQDLVAYLASLRGTL
jgi:cytochrome c oxidase cbb3-type subunit 3